MNWKLTTLLVLVLTIVAGAALYPSVLAEDDARPVIGKGGEVTLVDDPENILAKELPGSWTGDAEICERLGVEYEDKGWVKIEKDEAAQARVLKDLTAWLAELRASDKEEDKAALPQWERACQTIYLAGLIHQKEVAESSARFALTIMNGNPCVVLWLTEKAKPSGFARLSLAQDVDGDRDILFIGRDARDDMSAMVRKPVEEAD